MDLIYGWSPTAIASFAVPKTLLVASFASLVITHRSTCHHEPTINQEADDSLQLLTNHTFINYELFTIDKNQLLSGRTYHTLLSYLNVLCSFSPQVSANSPTLFTL